MKYRLIKGMALCCALSLTVGMAGCGNSKNSAKTENADQILFSYDGEDVTLKEGWIYAKMTAASYEQYYTSYFGENFWTMDMGTDEEPQTFEEYVKEQVINQIKQVIVLDHQAEKAGLSLTEDETADCEKYAKAFAEDENGSQILEDCNASAEDMQQIYEDNKLASKMQEEAVKDTDTEVSDDEARQTTIARIVFETTTEDEEGNVTDMTDKEKAEVKEKAQEALNKIKNGTSLEDVASEEEYSNTSETFGAGESEEGEDFEKKLTKVKDGELIDEVMECDNGYVVAQLTAYTDEDATAQQKETIISQRQQETFYEVYGEWTEELEEDWDYEEDVNQTLWAEVVLRSEDSTATESVEETAPAEEGDTAAETGTQAE